MKINNEKRQIWTPCGHLLPPILGGGGSSATSPLKIWDVMPHYLKTLFEQKNRKLIILTIFAWTTPLSWS